MDILYIYGIYNHFVGHIGHMEIYQCFHGYTNGPHDNIYPVIIGIWGFPEIGIPLHHPFQWDLPL